MAEPVERLVNLAIYLAATPVPATAEQVRAQVEGYPPNQETDAFLRMFERDKEDLRDAGFEILAVEDAYRIDPEASFASAITLTAEEAAVLRAAGTAFVDDPAFPFAEDLRLALAKISTAVDSSDLPVSSQLADETPAEQAALVAELDRAASARKRVSFGYTNSYREHKHHEVEPYGLFATDGRWYAVGRDVERDEIRVYSVSRVEALHTNASKPKSPDFDRPADFQVGRYIGLPFQYGADSFDAVVRFAPEMGWRAEALSAGTGDLRAADDGTVVWTVEARSPQRLAQWVIENGPGVSVTHPAPVLEALRAGLEKVAETHG